jgi:hypothetical protein
MVKEPDFDLTGAHKYFSANCFNKTWDFIDKSSRSAEDDLQMLQTCMASLWHWSQRTDAKPENYSVGFWQASRVFALLGNVDDARKYAQLSLDTSRELAPFYVGYAYEALARSEMAAGNKAKMNEYLTAARQQCDKVTDQDSKKLLAADLETLK